MVIREKLSPPPTVKNPDAKKDVVKVLHVINNLSPAGAETLLSLLAPAMKRRGVDAEIATIFKYDNRTLHDRLVSQGIRLHSLDFSQRYDIRIILAIRKLTAENTYDVVHANLFPTLYWVALAKPRVKKLIFTEHGTFNRRMNRSFFKPIERFIYGRYDSIVCVGNNVHRALSAWLPGLGPTMQMIYNGIDLDSFTIAQAAERKSFNIPQIAPVAAMIARFYSPKDHKTVIDAASLVPNLHVLFVGDGENRQAMQEHASILGLDKRIHFLGYRSDVASLLKLCDVYIHSSYNEGIPLSVAEAMACGIPVIASDVNGLNEIVKDKISGLLFKCADAGDLADKIQLVLQDIDMKKKLKVGAFTRALDFSLDITVDKLIALYAS
jgi:glycosyltransferase involved in cell wall biosynthesis